MYLRLFIVFLMLVPTLLVSQEVESISSHSLKEFAPDFEMIMEDGSQKKLSDFRGQIVYLSFWASWCKSCINGFTKYRGIRESISELGVVMLNVSIDQKPESWKSAVEKHQPTGIQAYVNKSDVDNDYQLFSIPLYEIIGKDGEFLYLSEEPGRDILQNFREFLK